MLLFSAAYAATLSLPVKLTYAEYTGWGEDPAIVDDVASATATVSNPETGASFATTGELYLKERSGAGTGELSFVGDPSGSLHTFAFYLLDATGAPLQKEPEILDIQFGNDGDGTVIARAGGNIIIKNPRIRKKNPRITTEDGTHAIAVEVGSLGVQAAYVGIQEISSSGAPLATHADFEARTADVYANFQGLLLDALVPLDTWKATLDGTLSVDGVSATHTEIEGGVPLEFDFKFFNPGAGAAALGNMLAYKPPKPKQETTTLGDISARTVVIRPGDQAFDSYDAAMNVLVEGDGRPYELGAILLPTGEGPEAVTDTLVTLDPSDLAIGGTASFTGIFPPKPEAQKVRTVSIAPLNEKGLAMTDWLSCTLTPTATSAVAGSKRLAWVGECLRDEEGRAILRGLRMTLNSAGTGTLSAEMVGIELQKATALGFVFGSTDLGVDTAKASAAVTETSFSLDWTFDTDADESDYALELTVFGATSVLDLEIVSDGMYDWDFADPTWTFGGAGGDAYGRASTNGTGTRSGAAGGRGNKPVLK